MDGTVDLEEAREDLQARLVFETAQLFFTGLQGGAPPTATKICEVLKQIDPRAAARLTRESVYPLLAKAASLGYVRFVPPVHQELTRRVRERFPQAPNIEVVNSLGPQFNEAVGARAAEVVAGLLRELKGSGNGSVGVGLGPGKSTLDFAVALSRILESSPELPRLDLFGITAGCIPSRPEYAPVSFFNLFPARCVNRRVAMWAETLVPADQLRRLKSEVVGVKEAFEAKDDIRIVVTGLGDADDEHDMLRQFYEASGRKVRKPAMVGNVQYRPFTPDGPVREKVGDMRAVTLFELDELVAMSKQKDRYVVLMARQCGLCAKTHANVLRHLLENPGLRVYTHVVIDLATALALLAGSEAAKTR